MSSIKKYNINLGVLLSLLFLSVGLFIFIGALGMKYWAGYGPGEGFVSVWVSGGLIIFSLISLIGSLKESGVSLGNILPDTKKERDNLIITGIGLVVFLVLVEYLGFLVGSIPLMILILSRGFSWKKSIVFGIVISVVCYLIFGELLDVPLPMGFLQF